MISPIPSLVPVYVGLQVKNTISICVESEKKTINHSDMWFWKHLLKDYFHLFRITLNYLNNLIAQITTKCKVNIHKPFHPTIQISPVLYTAYKNILI
jgi:hypothetical protein